MLAYISWNPDPVAFSLFGFDVRWYGLCWAMAFLSGYMIMAWLYKDQKLGKWVNDTHYIPYYVLYGFDKAGNPVPEDRIFSASGTLQPSHYHDNVVEPDNIALASLAVSEAPAFLENAKKNGISFFDAGGEGTITGTEVLFRKGPGKNHDVIGSFEKGEKVVIACCYEN